MSSNEAQEKTNKTRHNFSAHVLFKVSPQTDHDTTDWVFSFSWGRVRMETKKETSLGIQVLSQKALGSL